MTPYTSLVVVKPDERKEIEEELIREEKERKKAEELKRKLEVEKAKLKDEELLRGPPAAATDSLVLRDYSLRKSSDPAGRSSSSKRKGGFYGDPHFLIPLRPDLFICFDWDGKDGQVK